MNSVIRRSLTGAFQEKLFNTVMGGGAMLYCSVLRAKLVFEGFLYAQYFSRHDWDNGMRLPSLADFIDEVNNCLQSSPMLKPGFMPSSLILSILPSLDQRFPKGRGGNGRAATNQ